jgi:hypothetical protein
MNTITRTEVSHRAAAFSLAATLTVAILSTVNLLAVQPAPDSLLARHTAPAQVAAAPAPASARV